MLTLSDYFPKNTQYFYSYPIGDTFYHFNNGNPVDEELISARLLVCAGENVKIVVYKSTLKDKLLDLLEENSDLSFIPTERIIVLPDNIDERVLGNQRNELITEALVRQTSPGNLIMAQPILDDRLMDDYQIDPKLSIWLNDKKNLEEYVDHTLLPQRYARFVNGKEFFDSKVDTPLPCVVKVSSSSTGDGVRLCKNFEDLKQAKIGLKNIKGGIFIEKYIPYVHNIGFQFGIPFNKPLFFQPHIIGYNHQITTPEGVFLGGFIFKKEWDEKIEQIRAIIDKKILPKIQAMGWYGIGGFDVLIDSEGKFYIIDSNFRTTGMTAYVFLTENNIVSKSMVSFTATFKGSKREFVDKVLTLNKGKKKILTIISLIKKDDEYKFNAALLFDKKEELPGLALKLTNLAVKSEVLEMLKQNNGL